MLQDILVAGGIWIVLASAAWMHARNVVALRRVTVGTHGGPHPEAPNRAA